MTKSRTLIPRFVFTEWPKVEKILGPRPSELFPQKVFFSTEAVEACRQQRVVLANLSNTAGIISYIGFFSYLSLSPSTGITLRYQTYLPVISFLILLAQN